MFSRKHIFGYKFIAFSSIAIAVFSFLVWGHHMFTSGQSELVNMIFSALTFSVSIPSAIKVFNWLATMYKGRIQLDTPMLYALSFLFLFTIGGLTGLFLATLATDIHLHDTYFIVAHFHYQEEFTSLNQLSSLGSYIMAIAFFMIAGYLLHSLAKGKKAPANPWGANSLEWHTPSPPPFDNFDREMLGVDPYDYTGWKYDPAIEGYVPAGGGDGSRDSR